MVHSARLLNPVSELGSFTWLDLSPWQQAADFARSWIVLFMARGLASRRFAASHQAEQAADGDLTHNSDTPGLSAPVAEQSEAVSVTTAAKLIVDDTMPRDAIDALNGQDPQQNAALVARPIPAAAPTRRPLFGK